MKKVKVFAAHLLVLLMGWTSTQGFSFADFINWSKASQYHVAAFSTDHHTITELLDDESQLLGYASYVLFDEFPMVEAAGAQGSYPDADIPDLMEAVNPEGTFYWTICAGG